MRSLISILRSFLREEDGPTAVEYAVLLAAILLAVIAGIGVLGQTNGGIWLNNQQKLEEANF